MTPLELIKQNTVSWPDLNGAGFSLRSTCFKHRRFLEAIEKTASAHHYSNTNHCATGLLLFGLSGVGKTTILEFYKGHFPRKAENGVIKIPVLSVSVPSGPTVKNLAQEILQELGDIAAHKGSSEEKTQRIYTYIQRCQVEVILIDEFHHFFFAKTSTVFRHISDWLKNLMDRTSVCLILSGLPESEIIIKSNAQLNRRLSGRVELTPFSYEDDEDFKEFRGLLRAYAEIMPIGSEMPLHEANLARRFILACGGRLDFLRTILEEAVFLSKKTNRSELTSEIFAAAFRNKIWHNAPDRLNPFCEKSLLRPLTKSGEPYETGGYSTLIGSPVAVRYGLVGRKKGAEHG